MLWWHGKLLGTDNKLCEFQYGFQEGATVKEVHEFVNKMGYEIVWIEPGQWPSAEFEEGNWVNFEEEK